MLIISADTYNAGASGLAIIVPLTATIRSVPIHVLLNPPEGGIRVPSRILCDQVRSVARERLIRRWGIVSDATLDAVAERLRAVQGL